MIRLGKISFLYEVQTATGQPLLSITCERAGYRRRDGSVYVIIEGKHQTLTKRPDGSYSLITEGRMPG